MRKKGMIAVLDDCDPTYSGKASYEDNLSLFDTAGKFLTRVSGLNICQEIGSPHRMAFDLPGGRLWLTETVGQRLLQYDLGGKLLLSVPDVKASAVAVDPATHHVWVARSQGRINSGHTEVYDVKGRRVARYSARGYDLVYDPKGKAFWLAAQSLVKLSPAGKLLFETKVSDWCAISLAVDSRTGNVWVVSRRSSARRGQNALLGFDNSGKRLCTIELKEGYPFRVAVDPRDGAVWLTLMNSALQRYSAAGKLEVALKVPALTAEVDARTGNVWAVLAEEVRVLDRKGTVLKRFKHKASTEQAWIAGA
jgi:hypothetical protein